MSDPDQTQWTSPLEGRAFAWMRDEENPDNGPAGFCWLTGCCQRLRQEGGGRPVSFCSNAHLKAYKFRRQTLIDAIADLDKTLAGEKVNSAGRPTSETGRRAAAERRKAAWLLRQHPTLVEDD